MAVRVRDWALPPPRGSSDLGCLSELEELAEAILPRAIFGFVRAGVESGAAYHANLNAFRKLFLVPRTLTGSDAPDPGTELFGERWSTPFGIAPMGGVALGRFRGDLELARAAREKNLPFVLSGSSSIPMEQIPPIMPNAWFQAYVPNERKCAEALVDRVMRAGFRVLVVTVDVPVGSNRFHYERLGFSLPMRLNLRLVRDGLSHPTWLFGTALRTLLSDGVPHFENSLAERAGPMFTTALLTRSHTRIRWIDVEALRARFKGKIVLKGVLSATDAQRAAALGMDGIIVSNHGGRQFDAAPSPLSVLPSIVAAVPALPVMLDGGIRWGTDVLKAFALGARMVFVGRPFYYANALGGHATVSRAADLLRAEIVRDMVMLGIDRVTDIDSSYVVQ